MHKSKLAEIRCQQFSTTLLKLDEVANSDLLFTINDVLVMCHPVIALRLFWIFLFARDY